MRLILFLLSWPASFILEGMSISAFLGEPSFLRIPWQEGALLHTFGVLAALIAFFAWFPPEYSKTPFTTSALILGFVAPMPLIGLLALSFFRFLLNIVLSEDASRKYVMGTKTSLTAERLNLISRKAHQSVLEILSGKNNELRRNAILALRSLEPKKSLPVLRRAIGDADEQVRLLAQTQFNKIMLNLEMSIKKMEHNLNQDTAEASKLIELAEQYHELVFLGLSTEETEFLYLTRAVELLEIALEKEPSNLSARFFLMKCAVKQGNLKGAARAAEILRGSGFNQDFLRIWEAEMCFHQRDWAGLVSATEKLRDSKAMHPRVGYLIEFWLPANRHASPAL